MQSVATHILPRSRLTTPLERPECGGVRAGLALSRPKRSDELPTRPHVRLRVDEAPRAVTRDSDGPRARSVRPVLNLHRMPGLVVARPTLLGDLALARSFAQYVQPVLPLPCAEIKAAARS